MSKKESKVLRTQKWTIETIHYEDGTSTMTRTNDGYSPIELMGLSELVSIDVRNQILGRIKPSKVKRVVLVD